MNMKENYRTILKELDFATEQVSWSKFNDFNEMLSCAPHIFVTGKGRSGLIASTFANRLLHLGFSVSIIGEITSPHTQERDVLFVVSGSGETDSLLSIVKKAKNQGLKIVLLTMNPNSTIGTAADLIINVPGISPKVAKDSGVQSIQPMGTLFEQTSFLLLDAFVLKLMESTSMSSDQMFKNHADLE